MAFTRPTVSTIYERIKADIASRTTSYSSLPARSAYDILARVFAGSIHLCYGGLVWLSRQFFADTADEAYLIRFGILNGITRKAATYATGEVTISYIPNDKSISVPAGTSFTSEYTGLQYTFTDEGTISPYVSYTGTVVCTTPGLDGNAYGTDVTLDDDIDGESSNLFSVSSDYPFDGGVAEETIDELRARIILYKQKRPAGGRDADYELWSLEISGVTNVWVFDTYIGAGTVGIVIADRTLSVVPTSVKEAVQANINTKGPLGVKKDVLDPNPSEVNIYANITPNTSEVTSNISKNVSALFTSDAIPGSTVLLSAIRNAFANSGLDDYVITDISYKGVSIGVSNIETVNYELPFLNELVLYEL